MTPLHISLKGLIEAIQNNQYVLEPAKGVDFSDGIFHAGLFSFHVADKQGDMTNKVHVHFGHRSGMFGRIPTKVSIWNVEISTGNAFGGVKIEGREMYPMQYEWLCENVYRLLCEQYALNNKHRQGLIDARFSLSTPGSIPPE